MRYIAVFRTLAFASRARNDFSISMRPEIIKTPKNVHGGCSYSLEFFDGQLEHMLKITQKHSKGFVGIYKETGINHFDAIN